MSFRTIHVLDNPSVVKKQKGSAYFWYKTLLNRLYSRPPVKAVRKYANGNYGIVYTILLVRTRYVEYLKERPAMSGLGLIDTFGHCFRSKNILLIKWVVEHALQKYVIQQLLGDSRTDFLRLALDNNSPTHIIHYILDTMMRLDVLSNISQKADYYCSSCGDLSILKLLHKYGMDLSKYRSPIFYPIEQYESMAKFRVKKCGADGSLFVVHGANQYGNRKLLDWLLRHSRKFSQDIIRDYLKGDEFLAKRYLRHIVKMNNGDEQVCRKILTKLLLSYYNLAKWFNEKYQVV